MSSFSEIKDILLDTVKACTNKDEEFRSTVVYTDDIIIINPVIIIKINIAIIFNLLKFGSAF